MNYYTSDLHLDHKNIIQYEDRPFNDIDEMNNYIIYKWNQKVKPGDNVYILGDFAFCKGARANDFFKRLNGNKYLIRGNHDSFLGDKDFDRSLCVWIRDYAKIDDNGYKVILFHYPIAVWDCKHHGAIHLFGHIHKNKLDGNHHPLEHQEPNSYNVGVDVNGFEPLSLQEIIDKYGYKKID
jgi:calcineurin-like phosphoesterase family protein